MIEIRHRAWLQQEKKMIYGVGVCGAVVLVPDDEGRTEIDLKQYSQYANAKEGYAFENTGAIPLRYTGLKDMNGKEIYEGDMLQMFKHSDDTHRHEKARIWDGDEYVDDIREVKYERAAFYTISNYGIKSSFMAMARPGQSFEVIGNIYENPDLLGDTQ